MVIAGALLALAAQLYGPLCAPCHGESGRGDGPAADLYWPRPRDLTTDTYRLGADPRAVRRVLKRGVPGTGMPAFSALSAPELDALVAHVGTLRGEWGVPKEDTPPRPDGVAPASDEAWTGAGCAVCHGQHGAGDGAAAAGLRTTEGESVDLFDLRTAPFKGGEGIDDIFEALTCGRPAGGMPAFAHLPEDTRWALAQWVSDARSPQVIALNQPAQLRLPPRNAPSVAHDAWWGEARPIDLSAVPALTQGDALRCGKCHPEAHRTWRKSRHAAAMGPGVTGQYVGRGHGFKAACDTCHAPALAQVDDGPLRDEGVTCAVCHLRGAHKGGPIFPAKARAPARGMRAVPMARFQRSDFCLPCHNLPMSGAVEGAPLLDTWREWAASPYLPAGVQCQHCHMADGDHSFRGAHDVDAAREAITLSVSYTGGAKVEVVATVKNVGAGHHFPTTATPRAVLRVRQLAGATVLSDTEQLWAIGRTMRFASGRWTQIADTRIPAGESLSRRYQQARAAGATHVEVSLHLFPDWFYAREYRRMLAGALPQESRRAFERAIAEAEASVSLLYFERQPLIARGLP